MCLEQPLSKHYKLLIQDRRDVNDTYAFNSYFLIQFGSIKLPWALSLGLRVYLGLPNEEKLNDTIFFM